MKYKVNDRVRIKSLEWYNENKNSVDNYDVVFANGWHFSEPMSNFCGKELIIENISHATNPPHYIMQDAMFAWTDEMIEGLVEEETLIERFDDNGLPFNEWLSHKGAFHVPDGYELKDENGNVINAQKIVLEKKKKEYPITYCECKNILGLWDIDDTERGYYKADLIDKLQMLLICRDAYWKIAGEDMGLEKPWKPDWSDASCSKYIIDCFGGEICKGITAKQNTTFAFPTKEMRDAFKENFDADLEICKELL